MIKTTLTHYIIEQSIETLYKNLYQGLYVYNISKVDIKELTTEQLFEIIEQYRPSSPLYSYYLEELFIRTREVEMYYTE